VDAPSISDNGILGKQVRGARRQLDLFELPEAITCVEYISDEVTSVCPKTGQPDWYTVRIELTGSRLGIESKSLKLYLQSFRDEGQFCEQFADRIAHDVKSATEAEGVRTVVLQKPRGGVAIEATADL
jgi:7-cyano-7-deazaguanine reductase